MHGGEFFMAEEEKNEETEAPEEASTETDTESVSETKAEKIAAEEIDAAEEKNEDAVEVEDEAATDEESEAAAEVVAEAATNEESEATAEVVAETAAEKMSETAAEAKSEAAPQRVGSEGRRPGGPPGRGRGRPDYRRQNSGHGRPHRGYFRRKVCRLCVNKINAVDYKDVDLLKRFVTERGKIMPRRMTGTCAKHQRIVSAAVKRARTVALLPYVTK
jgi:small subunit ribosomal protein S18